VQRINELVRGKRGVTPETAWLLSQALATTPSFWLDLQMAYDLARTRPAQSVEPLVSSERAHITIGSDLERLLSEVLDNQPPPAVEWNPPPEPEIW